MVGGKISFYPLCAYSKMLRILWGIQICMKNMKIILTPDLPHPPGCWDQTPQGAKSEVAHKWAKWLPHPCRIGDPHRFRAGGKIRSGPQVGKVATSPLPYRGSPPLQSGGQNQKWPTSGQNGYLTPAVSGIPTASERGEGVIFSPKTPQMYVQNDQCDEGIILRYVCWGARDPSAAAPWACPKGPPPPPRTHSTGPKRFGGGVGARV